MSKEPRPLPQPGDPLYRDPSKPHPVSPAPPPKRRTFELRKCCHEHRVDELEAALREIEKIANGYKSWQHVAEDLMGDIENKCREALREGT